MTLTVSPHIAKHLELVQGQTLDEKVLALLEAYLTTQIKECEQDIGSYEVKCRTTFAEFVEAWTKGAIPGKYSHAVERDYMEWEGLEAEKKRWLELFKHLPHEAS
jgi:hypothetical protein